MRLLPRSARETGSSRRSAPTRAGELPCVSCHAEKRGPFVFKHVSGVAGNCMSCHRAARLVESEAVDSSPGRQLCLECHSTLTGDDTRIAAAVVSQHHRCRDTRTARPATRRFTDRTVRRLLLK